MDSPVGAVAVPAGARFVFLKTSPRNVRRVDNSKVRKHEEFEVEKLCVRRGLGSGTRADVAVLKLHFEDDVLVRREPLSLCPDLSSGAYRLRVMILGRREYLHRIVAYAFHRAQYAGAVRDFADFKSQGFQGDHLCDRRLREVPEWCYAGWIEAVPASVHRERTAQRGRAREVRSLAIDLERQARQAKALGKAFESLRAQKLRRTRGSAKKLADLQKQHKRAAGVKSMLAGLTFDIDESNPHGGGVPGGQNPCLSWLFVDSGLTPRRALLAYIDRNLKSVRKKIRRR